MASAAFKKLLAPLPPIADTIRAAELLGIHPPASRPALEKAYRRALGALCDLLQEAAAHEVHGIGLPRETIQRRIEGLQRRTR